MSIEIRGEESRDLLRNASWPIFSGRPELRETNARILAYTVSWKSTDSDPTGLLAQSANELSRRFVRLIDWLGYTGQVFVADATLQPKAATVLYRGIWGGPCASRPEAVAKGKEVRLDCDYRVRFGTLAKVVDAPGFKWAIEMGRNFNLVIPIFLRAPLEMYDQEPLRLLKIGFPPDGCSDTGSFDWARFAVHISSIGGICMRQNIDLSRDRISVDFFLDEDDWSRVKGVLPL